MKHIVAITLASAHSNFDRIVEFFGQKVRLSQYGTDFDLQLAEELIHKFDGQCDCICISGLPQSIRYRNHRFVHPTTKKFKSLPKETFVVDGSVFRDVYIPWTLRDFCKKNPQLIKQQRVGIYTGLFLQNVVSIFEEFDAIVQMADPYFFLKLPYTLASSKELEKFFHYMRPLLARIPIDRPYKRNFEEQKFKANSDLAAFLNCDIFVIHGTMLNLIDLRHLKNKTLVVDYLNPYMEKKLKDVGVSNVVSCMPQLIDEPYATFAILEAFFQCFKEDDLPLSSDDILQWIDELNLKPFLRPLNQQVRSRPHKFAFIIHPLSRRDLFRHPLLRPLAKKGKKVEKTIEKMAHLLPGVRYGRISGVRSEHSQQEIDGTLYAVFDTPKMLLSSDPEVIYKKLIKLCEMASREGHEIIGLGAYTKIVGDAGVTVDQHSPIPVTTGNSLSAASTLWAANLAVKKMGMVQRGENRIYQGRAMVIGATGSIGSVSAKLLAQTWREVVLVAPRGHKLLELKATILKVAPQARVIVATNPNREAPECDLIITATSNQGNRVLDIEKVRPGCVICDVSRPFDITEEDALKRPDVLVIASGEVELPGKVQISCDIGLEGSVVYACLAETALLAMEGKLESFTLSRNISYKKVVEIDELARKHGVRLAAIMGHAGEITDKEIALCREHALQKLSLVLPKSQGPKSQEVEIEVKVAKKSTVKKGKATKTK